MKKIIMVLVLGVIVGLFNGSYQPANAQGNDASMEKTNDMANHWKEKREKMEAMTQEVYAQLNLTDEQRAQLEENKKNHASMKEDDFKQMRENMKLIGEELKKKDYDVSKIKAWHEQSKQMRNAMADSRLEGILMVRKILTDEQFAKFSELMEKNKPHGWGKDQGDGGDKNN